MIKRIKSAFRTNEPQATAVILFTGLNFMALIERDDAHINFMLYGIAILFWPCVALIFNLIDPIPAERKE